jgi:hypothetical protein
MNTITFLVTLFVATVVSLPHTGMIDTPDVRDVGLIFDDFNYSKYSVTTHMHSNLTYSL